jgi:bifunctional non-homologous end joining protein LigD
VRCPAGAQQECFFQKHSWAGLEEAVRRVDIGGDEGLAIADLRGLIALVQASVLEIHPWGSTLDALEAPDRVTFDLDPADDVGFPAVVAAALEVRERLRAMRLDSFVKTTGGKGLHVVVPLAPKAGWDAIKAFAESLSTGMARDAPERYTANLAKRARTGRIFVDYLRNGRGATAVAAYSTRARPGAPVSVPVGWDELATLQAGSHYRVENLLGRLDHLGRDPWEELMRSRQTLPSPQGRARRR